MTYLSVKGTHIFGKPALALLVVLAVAMPPQVHAIQGELETLHSSLKLLAEVLPEKVQVEEKEKEIRYERLAGIPQLKRLVDAKFHPTDNKIVAIAHQTDNRRGHKVIIYQWHDSDAKWEQHSVLEHETSRDDQTILWLPRSYAQKAYQIIWKDEQPALLMFLFNLENDDVSIKSIEAIIWELNHDTWQKKKILLFDKEELKDIKADELKMTYAWRNNSLVIFVDYEPMFEPDSKAIFFITWLNLSEKGIEKIKISEKELTNPLTDLYFVDDAAVVSTFRSKKESNLVKLSLNNGTVSVQSEKVPDFTDIATVVPFGDPNNRLLAVAGNKTITNDKRVIDVISLAAQSSLGTLHTEIDLDRFTLKACNSKEGYRVGIAGVGEKSQQPEFVFFNTATTQKGTAYWARRGYTSYGGKRAPIQVSYFDFDSTGEQMLFGELGIYKQKPAIKSVTSILTWRENGFIPHD